MPVTAPITNISGCSLHDGPGVRTVSTSRAVPSAAAGAITPRPRL